MPTVKLVVLGASGVGKTSLRGQFISGRFSTGYRASIGADFITKTLPHPTNPSESVTLQIWDTAGQERFSSLSNAFFRGADAVLLMFDVNTPSTLDALPKWWAEFRAHAPVPDEDLRTCCCVVVGNKVDLESGDGRVSEAQVQHVLDVLVPPSPPPSPPHEDQHPLAASIATLRPPPPAPPPAPSDSIAIHLAKPRSRSSAYLHTGTASGTVTSTHTSLSMYHTPSSSVSDVFASARSSPEPWGASSHSHSHSRSSSASRLGALALSPSSPSMSVRSRQSSAATITPALLLARESAAASTSSFTTTTTTTTATTPASSSRPRLFFTSAKTGAGVCDVFAYVVRRVVRRWEAEARWQEVLEARGPGVALAGPAKEKAGPAGCCRV
ncbi:hypothetical protein H0H81_011452 [Sphagnurus paluster]|uniref:Ras-domain-containing protein n=1 Tax=Sphagnurus paluster TaxID=117069 RepID=A0A9P7GIH7_9AGAR|nr:hypothetical protein H0H81_011452 [Sphagnurus paluster]